MQIILLCKRLLLNVAAVFFYCQMFDGGSVPFWENASLTFSPHTPLLAEKMTG